MIGTASGAIVLHATPDPASGSPPGPVRSGDRARPCRAPCGQILGADEGCDFDFLKAR